MANTHGSLKFCCTHIQGTLQTLEGYLNDRSKSGWAIVSVSHCDVLVFGDGPERGNPSGRWEFLVTLSRVDE